MRLTRNKLKKIMTPTIQEEEEEEEKHIAQEKIETPDSNPMYDTLLSWSKIAIRMINAVSKICGVYFAWIALHYSASHLYVKLCVPDTLYGFLMSPFMTVTPHCQGLRWVVTTAASMINNMWVMLGGWLCSTIFTTNVPSAVAAA
jgi:hypothetical protein